MNALLKDLQLAVGKNVRRRRQLMGLSQVELALRAGIDISYVGRLERGQVNVTIDKLLKLSLVFNCEVRYLFPDKGRFPELLEHF